MSAEAQRPEVADMRKAADLQKRTNRFLRASEIGFAAYAYVIFDISFVEPEVGQGPLSTWILGAAARVLFLASLVAMFFWRSSDEYTKSLWRLGAGTFFVTYALFASIFYLAGETAEYFENIEVTGFRSTVSNIGTSMACTIFFVSIFSHRFANKQFLKEHICLRKPLDAFARARGSTSEQTGSARKAEELQVRTKRFWSATKIGLGAVAYIILYEIALETFLQNEIQIHNYFSFINTISIILVPICILILFIYRNNDEYIEIQWHTAVIFSVLFFIFYFIFGGLILVSSYHVFGIDLRVHLNIIPVIHDFGTALVFFVAIHWQGLSAK